MLHHRKSLFRKLLVYYGTFILVLLGIANLAPGWLEYLPVGGLNELFTGGNFSSVNDEILASYVPINTFKAAIQLTTALTGAILVMIPILNRNWI